MQRVKKNALTGVEKFVWAPSMGITLLLCDIFIIIAATKHKELKKLKPIRTHPPTMIRPGDETLLYFVFRRSHRPSPLDSILCICLCICYGSLFATANSYGDDFVHFSAVDANCNPKNCERQDSLENETFWELLEQQMHSTKTMPCHTINITTNNNNKIELNLSA